MKRIALATVLVLAAAPLTSRAADELYVYPTKGQSAEQQERDTQACHDWAVKQTGVDPVKLAETKPEPRQGMGAGMAAGAGLGALRGAAEGDSGEMAARGAGVGRIIAVVRARRKMQEQHDAQMQLHQDQEAQLGKYDRAYGACLTGRGYSVQ